MQKSTEPNLWQVAQVDDSNGNNCEMRVRVKEPADSAGMARGDKHVMIQYYARDAKIRLFSRRRRSSR